MLLLRDVAESDLDVFFEHWADDALRMAAFTPADAHDRDAFEARWAPATDDGDDPRQDDRTRR